MPPNLDKFVNKVFVSGLTGYPNTCSKITVHVRLISTNSLHPELDPPHSDTTERDFMKSLTKEKRYDMIDAFNSTSSYLDDLLNIDNIHFEHMVHRIYPAQLQLNKANASDTEAAFFRLKLIDS